MSTARTTEQWLGLDDKLAVELAKVFTPGPWKHDWEFFDKFDDIENIKIHAIYSCDKCGHTETLTTHRGLLPFSNSLRRNARRKELKKRNDCKPCSVPDPITIDWNTAMEGYRKQDYVEVEP